MTVDQVTAESTAPAEHSSALFNAHLLRSTTKQSPAPFLLRRGISLHPTFSHRTGPATYSRNGSAEKQLTLTGVHSEMAETMSFAMYPSSPGIQHGKDSPFPATCHGLGRKAQDHEATAEGYGPVTPILHVRSCGGWPSPPLVPADFELGHFELNRGQGPPFVRTYTLPPSATVLRSQPLLPPIRVGSSHGLPPPAAILPSQSLSGAEQDELSPAVLAPEDANLPSPFTDGYSGFDTLPSMPMEDGTDALPAEELTMKTPSSMVTPNPASPSCCFDESPGPCTVASTPPAAPPPPPATKMEEESYAKLIYKAFMSRRGHSMTVQDIYQWFRENTSKAVTEKGGWQNSIRHNLSMNAAFKKRTNYGGVFEPVVRDACGAFKPVQGQDGGGTPCSRRPHEWVLEDWAVRFGVQSTTRYRKGNGGKRCGSGANGGIGGRYGGPPVGPEASGAQHDSKRAVSGRKGGCAARDAKRRRDRAISQAAMAIAQGTHFSVGYRPELPSPPRSTIGSLYDGEPIAGSRLGAMAHGPQGGLYGASKELGALLGDGNCGGTYSGGTYSTCAGGMSTSSRSSTSGERGDGYMIRASVGVQSNGGHVDAYGPLPSLREPLPYGDVEQRYGSRSSAGAGTTSQARMFEPLPDGLCDWNSGSI
ncbi:hypothetical protein RJ55_04986 [Drechmeria coniospora]|nr:hypothetical protein RJ55_04986 [Drechmeria coniospora]